MSAPLVVNTADGACWTRRAVTSDGVALYALADVCSCPEFVMATFEELAARGIVGSAFALPMPGGPEPEPKPRTMLDHGRDALRARMTKDDLRLVLENVITYAASLETERHRTNEWADDAAEALRRDRDRIAELEAERTARQNEVSAAVGYTPGFTWPHLVGLVASNTASLVQAERDARALRTRIAELEDKKELADRERVELQTALERALSPFCEDPKAAAAAAAEAKDYHAEWLLRDAQRLLDRVAELEALAGAVTEYRLDEPGYGLLVRCAPGPDRSGWAVLESRRTERGRRVWTSAGWQYSALLSAEELFCWPSAEVAVAEARRVMPGAVVRDGDDVTPQVQKLRALLAGQREQAGGDQS